MRQVVLAEFMPDIGFGHPFQFRQVPVLSVDFLSAFVGIDHFAPSMPCIFLCSLFYIPRWFGICIFLLGCRSIFYKESQRACFLSCNPRTFRKSVNCLGMSRAFLYGFPCSLLFTLVFVYLWFWLIH